MKHHIWAFQLSILAHGKTTEVLIPILSMQVMRPMIFYKVFFFFGHIRPFYSQVHNLIIMLVLYPCYLFAILTLKKYPIEQSAKVFICTFILSQAAVVALYMEDWDGRFLLPVIPFVFLLASPQIGSFFNPVGFIKNEIQLKKENQTR